MARDQSRGDDAAWLFSSDYALLMELKETLGDAEAVPDALVSAIRAAAPPAPRETDAHRVGASDCGPCLELVLALLPCRRVRSVPGP